VAVPSAVRVNPCGCAGVGTTRLGVRRQSSHLQASPLSSGAAVSMAFTGAVTYCNRAASVASVAEAYTEITRCTVSVRAAAAGGAGGLTGAADPALLAGCAATDSAGPAEIATATAAASQKTLAAVHAASGGTPTRPVEHTHSHVTAAVAKAAVAAAATDEDHMGAYCTNLEESVTHSVCGIARTGEATVLGRSKAPRPSSPVHRIAQC